VQRKWVVGIVGAALAVGVLACQSPFDARIGLTYTSRDAQGNFENEDFLSDTPVYTIVATRGGDSTETRVEWRYLGEAPAEEPPAEATDAEVPVEAEPVIPIQEQGEVAGEQTIIGGGRHTFTFEVPESGRRDTGIYTANIYLNGVHVNSLEFTVVP